LLGLALAHYGIKALIALRRSNPALHDGAMTMLDTSNPSVLSYVRSNGKAAVVVAMNCTAEPQTVSLDLSPANLHGSSVKTLATDDPNLKSATQLTGVTLAPYTTWIASVK